MLKSLPFQNKTNKKTQSCISFSCPNSPFFHKLLGEKFTLVCFYFISQSLTLWTYCSLVPNFTLEPLSLRSMISACQIQLFFQSLCVISLPDKILWFLWHALFSIFLTILWRRKWQSTPELLSGKSHGQRSLVGYTVHGVAKSWTPLRDFTHFTYYSINLFHSSLPTLCVQYSNSLLILYT